MTRPGPEFNGFRRQVRCPCVKGPMPALLVWSLRCGNTPDFHRTTARITKFGCPKTPMVGESCEASGGLQAATPHSAAHYHFRAVWRSVSRGFHCGASCDFCGLNLVSRYSCNHRCANSFYHLFAYTMTCSYCHQTGEAAGEFARAVQSLQGFARLCAEVCERKYCPLGNCTGGYCQDSATALGSPPDLEHCSPESRGQMHLSIIQ
jgi:hypothetical protein